MRQACMMKGIEGDCGEPAVDFIMVHEGMDKMWLCAKHFDRWIRLMEILGWRKR